MTAFHSPYQHTLARTVSCEGVGLHSGETVRLALTPAEAGAGIVFKRTDVAAPVSYVGARYNQVTDTMLGTTIANEHGTAVSTIEHLMAALWGAGIDNAYIEISGPEVPIMDGSAQPFLDLIATAGVAAQDHRRFYVRILKPVEVKDGESRARIEPDDAFRLDIAIEFPHRAIAHQRARYDFGEETFERALGTARTFGFSHEVEKLRALGLARGGSLANAIVIGPDGVLNPGGLRSADEFVRHKALDCVGDYFLSPGRLLGNITTTRPGHGINNKLLRAVFADHANWRYQDRASVVPEKAALPPAAALKPRQVKFVEAVS